MPPIHGPYPYHLEWRDLVPESTSKMELSKVELVSELASLDGLESELERIFDAALALAGRMLTERDYKTWSRGEILAAALDTAMVWERG